MTREDDQKLLESAQKIASCLEGQTSLRDKVAADIFVGKITKIGFGDEEFTKEMARQSMIAANILMERLK